MGITGLLPFLKKASCTVNIKEFSGYTVAVDTYCWLHRSSYACAMDLALGNPTDQYVRYTLKYLELLLSCNVKPILVFDGASLPSKAETEKKRRESKEAYRKKAAEHLSQGNRDAAQECFQRSVFVTPQMAHDVLLAARNLGVDCIVAPYEADAQLAYLNRAGYADLVITEDSDLLLFGCRQVIFKLDLTGTGILVAVTAGIGELCCGMRPNQFTEHTLRFMGILSGCDYFSGIPGIGLATAAKILRQTRLSDFRELLNKIGLYVNLSSAALSFTMHDDGAQTRPSTDQSDSTRGNGRATAATKRLHPSVVDAAVRAERTFRLQVVFDPGSREQRRLTDPTPEDISDELRLCWSGIASNETDQENLFSFAGQVLADRSLAMQMALGNVRFDDGQVISKFDPDAASQNIVPEQLRKPRSENCLLAHFSNSSKSSVRPSKTTNSPDSTRPVLGQLGLGTKSVAVDALKQPNQQRLRLSIWNKNFPTQKVWIHRNLNSGTTTASFHCLSVSSAVQDNQATTVMNAATINTEEDDDAGEIWNANKLSKQPHHALSTHGKRLLLSGPICESLQRLAKRSSDVPTRTLEAESKRDSLDDQTTILTDSDILKTYKHTPVKVTTPPHPPKNLDRGQLASSVLSSSAYFPPPHQETSIPGLISSDSRRRNEDDVANALQTALESSPEPPVVSRSPVFSPNPFRSSFRQGNAALFGAKPQTPLRSPTLPNDPVVADEPCGSPTLDGISAACTLKPNNPIAQESCGSPTFQTTPIRDSCNLESLAWDGSATTPPPSHYPDEDDDNMVEMSPNFLNAHIYHPSPEFPGRSVPQSCENTQKPKGELHSPLSTSDSIRRFMAAPENNVRRRGSVATRGRSVSRRDSRGTSKKSTNPVQNSTLESFFKQWQFRSS